MHRLPHPAALLRVRFAAALVLLLPSSLPGSDSIPASATAAAAPKVFSWPADRLELLKNAGARLPSPLGPSLARLRAEADRALHITPPSVMDKTLCAASGDKHDYFSFAPYWWPDPSKPDGKPYLRRDGEVNPESQQGTDSSALARLADAVESLALAHHVTGESAYAEHAARCLRTWFVDPATRMNPNLQYAQAVPGRNDGRAAGVLQGRHFGRLADAAALLADAPAWTTADRAVFRKWLEDYYQWLTTAKNAREEEDAENNHGTWFDVQAAHLALALGRDDEARARLQAALTRRLAAQVEPNGRQPREFARTKSLEYSIFNLEALFALARLGSHAGVDWWNFETGDHRSLARALNALAPYADPQLPWPKQDVGTADRTRITPLIAEYVNQRSDRALLEMLIRGSRGAEHRDARWRLFYPAPAPFVAPKR